LRILIISDAWHPQVNGVVRSLAEVTRALRGMGHDAEVVGPDRFRTIPCPTYPEIRLARGARRLLPPMIEGLRPEAVHIATEGPLGWAARRWARARGLPFTTSFHTMFPDYLAMRAGVPRALTFAVLRRFHAPARAVMVSTPTMERLLAARGFRRLVRWQRGVDVDLFRPGEKGLSGRARPIQLFVGRLAVEKNIAAFLSLPTPGTKVVVGDGPMRAELEGRFPDAVFAGAHQGRALARYYAAADVFVFPSRTETFGLVMLEALAAGVPVAAYPVQGPLDVLDGAGVGAMDEDLGRAVVSALKIPGERCRAHALAYSWEASARQFLGHLTPAR
jgi:glycosyltransferase involved in cell wall biosynthesis